MSMQNYYAFAVYSCENHPQVIHHRFLSCTSCHLSAENSQAGRDLTNRGPFRQCTCRAGG